MTTTDGSVGVPDVLAGIAVLISVVALSRTERERSRSLLRDCHARVSQLEQEVARDVYWHFGFIDTTKWSEDLEAGYLECRQIYRRISRKPECSDRKKLNRILEAVDETTVSIHANSDVDEEDLQEMLNRRADHLPNFIRALAWTLHRAAYCIENRDLPRDDDPGIPMMYEDH